MIALLAGGRWVHDGMTGGRRLAKNWRGGEKSPKKKRWGDANVLPRRFPSASKFTESTASLVLFPSAVESSPSAIIIHSARSQKNSHHRTGDGAELDHGRHIGLDVGLLHRGKGLDVNGRLKVVRVEGARDEALVDAARGAEQAKGNHGKPQAPVEDTLRLAEVLEAEDVDGFLDAACHGVGVAVFALSIIWWCEKGIESVE